MSVVARDLLAPGLTVAIPDRFIPEYGPYSEFSRDAGPLTFKLATVVEVAESGEQVLIEALERVDHAPYHRYPNAERGRKVCPIPQGHQVWVDRTSVHHPDLAHEAAAKEAEHKRLQRVVADEFGDARGLNPMWLAQVAERCEELNRLREGAARAAEIIAGQEEEEAVLDQFNRAQAERDGLGRVAS